MTGAPPTTAIADVVALRGQRAWLSPPLLPFVTCDAPVVGPAATVQLEPGAPRGGAFEELYELLSGDLSGAVLVVAGAETVPGAVWGEILSRAACQAGARAAVVVGGVRDRTSLAGEGLPVWGAFESTVGAVGMAHVVSTGTPVAVDGLQVAPGDPVVVDGEGVVALPASLATGTLDLARRYAEAEERVLGDLSSGVRLADAYEHKRIAARLISETDGS